MIEKKYPNIAEWVKSYGWIEIGQDEYRTSFVRALDIGGLVWEGKNAYASMDEAFKEMDNHLQKEIAIRTSPIPQPQTLSATDIKNYRHQIQRILKKINYNRHWETIWEVVKSLDTLHKQATGQAFRGAYKNALTLMLTFGEEVIPKYEQIEEETQLADFLETWAEDLADTIRNAKLSDNEKQNLTKQFDEWASFLSEYGLDDTLDKPMAACIK